MKAVCPYCEKEKIGVRPGRYRCSRCTGRFELYSDGSIDKLGRLEVVKWISGITSLAFLAALIFIHWQVPTSYGLRVIENVILGLVFFTSWGGFVIHALVTKEILTRARSNFYKEDSPKLYWVAICIYMVLAFIGFVMIVLALFGIVNFGE